MATKVATLAKRAARQTAKRTGAISGGVEVTHLRTHLTWLSGQMRDVDDNLASLKHTYAEMGERSDWADPRLAQLDETIRFWDNRLAALRAQLRDARAYLMSFQARVNTRAVNTRAKAASDDLDAGQRGAQPIVREAW